jgi:hypothetical protein
MVRSVGPYITAVAALAALAGCSGLWEHEARAPWRAEAEEACLAQGLAHVSAYVQSASEIDGPGVCGLTHPFKIKALASETVMLNTAQTLACPMLPALDQWLIEVVQPEAQARFGQPVIEIKSLGSYGCRSMNNQYGAALSEHAFGNAIDIGGFVLADGRVIDVMRGWRGDDTERDFLHRVHAGACRYFNTVLGPGSDAFHYNHIHVDLARHTLQRDGTMRHICKPVSAPEPAADPSSEPPALISQPQAPSIYPPRPVADIGLSDRSRVGAPMHSPNADEEPPAEESETTAGLR